MEGSIRYYLSDKSTKIVITIITPIIVVIIVTWFLIVMIINLKVKSDSEKEFQFAIL